MHRSLLLLICSLALFSAQTVPFTHLFMQTHEAHATQAKTFLWGLSGNITFHLDEAFPENSEVILSVYETAQQKLSSDDENLLNDYLELSRVDDFVAMSFKATQIALSVYPPKHCGMFLDLEDTLDMDIPVDAKKGMVDMKIMLNLVFDLQNQDELQKDYNFLEGVCNSKAAAIQ